MKHEIGFDETDGILICRILGCLEVADADSFGEDMRRGVAEARRRAARLKTLIDNREGWVSVPAAAAILAEQMKATMQPGDRSAILVPNSLGKIQARRNAASENEIFLSESAARTWLRAFDRG